jgi:molecular chaperone GrpE (heat shock protein)
VRDLGRFCGMSQDPPAAAIAKLRARAQLARELARALPSSALARRLLDIANELEAAAATLERQQDPHAGGVC